MRPSRIAAALVLAGCATSGAAAQDTRLPLRQDSSAWLGLGGQLRLRAEGWNGFGFGVPAVSDDGFALGRFLYHADLHVARSVSVFAEVKSSLATQRILPGGRRTLDEDVFDLQQLYGEWAAPIGSRRVTTRVGRADLRFGRERLVSPLDWANTRRIFQGASGTFAAPGVTVTAFWATPVMVRRRTPNVADSTRRLYGVYASRTRPGSRLNSEVYWLRTESANAAFNGTAGRERRHTVGQHVTVRAPERGGLDADFETAYQFGSIGMAPVRAWMVSMQSGWTFTGRSHSRGWIGLDVASGDDSTGGTVRTFNQLYPLGHAFLGFADVHGRQNIVDVSAGASRQLPGRLLTQLDVHRFWRATGNDALYGADGTVARPPGAGLSRSVGTELDLTVRRSVWGRRLLLQAGYSRYWRGQFVRQSGGRRDLDWIYLQTTVAL